MPVVLTAYLTMSIKSNLKIQNNINFAITQTLFREKKSKKKISVFMISPSASYPMRVSVGAHKEGYCGDPDVVGGVSVHAAHVEVGLQVVLELLQGLRPHVPRARWQTHGHMKHGTILHTQYAL